MGSNVATAFPKRLSENWRAKIKTGVIIQRLSDHVLGKLELSNTQIQAAKILLSKVVPDLQQASAQVMHSHTHTVRHIEINPVQVTAPQSPSMIESVAESVTYESIPALIEQVSNEGDQS